MKIILKLASYMKIMLMKFIFGGLVMIRQNLLSYDTTYVANKLTRINLKVINLKRE